jgi:hypothetical protein
MNHGDNPAVPQNRISDLDQFAKKSKPVSGNYSPQLDTLSKEGTSFLRIPPSDNIRINSNSSWFEGPVNSEGRIFESSERNVSPTKYRTKLY